MFCWDALKTLLCGCATNTDAKAFSLTATTVTTSDGGVTTTNSTLTISTNDVDTASLLLTRAPENILHQYYREHEQVHKQAKLPNHSNLGQIQRI